MTRDSDYYSASTTPEIVEIAPVRAIAVSGVGAPGGAAHMQAIKTLYEAAAGVAEYGSGSGREPDLPPMEGLWWVEDERPPFEVPRDEWHWQLHIQVPAGSTSSDVNRERGVEVIELDEGLSVQALHVGPYATEPETLAAMDELMKRERLEPNGRHHEIYLTPVTDNPEGGRTILRQPVRRSRS
jgi:hypothetical protein